jgi:hypothetical protein
VLNFDPFSIDYSTYKCLQIPIGTSRVPIGTSTTNWFFEYQLVLPEYQLVLQLPIGTLTTNWYFEYQLLLRIPWVTIQQEKQQEQQSGYKSALALHTCG